MNYWLLGALLVIGGIDVYLAATKQRTISQAYQMWFPTAVDIAIFGGGILALCLWKRYCPELDFALAVVMAGFFGHIVFPNKERYGER